MVHGSMDRGSSFRRVAAHLPDWTVVTYDRRGYAGSTEVTPSATFTDQVDDLIDILDGRQAVGAGHSLGGDIVLAAAERRPDLIDTAVVWEAPQPWQPWWSSQSAGSAAFEGGGESSPQDAAERFMRRMIGDVAWDRLPVATREQRRSEGAALLADLRSIRVGSPPFDAASITIPVVLGHGTESRSHHVEGTQRLAETLPRGELSVIQGGSHGAHRAHPEEFASLVRRALERRSPRD
jgi:pimeloyl-ACP methyl ester carboxylesterase